MIQTQRTLQTLALAGITLFLAACATQPPAPIEDRSVAEQVRAPAAEQTRGLQVYPLRNPAVNELSDAALAAEQQGDLDQATLLLERALRIEPRDPELLQHMAELRLERGEWEQAESFASRSFDVGPRVGEICQRNWRTIALSQERLSRFDEAANARERLQNCQVEPPSRL
ncbi:MAG: tetratricopeptide repeat protein [Pseudomonadota bacterium]